MTREELEKLSDDELKALLKKRKTQVSKADVMQLGLKVTLNSAYGMIGNQYSRYYDLRIAEGITVSGQLSIRWIERKLNEYLNKTLGTVDQNFTVAGDTDSIYISLAPLVDMVAPDKSKLEVVAFLDKVCEQKIQPYINKCYEELATYMNAFDQKMFMAREVIADRAVWRAKKNYILNVYNSEGVQYDEPKLKIMGIESTRSSTPEICRDAIKNSLKVMMTDTEEAAQLTIRSFKKDFLESPIEDISFPRGVSDLDKWDVPDDAEFKSKTPIHVKAAITYNRLVKKLGLEKQYRLITGGTKLKFAYLIKNNPTGNNAIAFPDILPPEFQLDDYVHRMLQYEKSYLDPMRSVFDVIGWNVVKQHSIENLFE